MSDSDFSGITHAYKASVHIHLSLPCHLRKSDVKGEVSVSLGSECRFCQVIIVACAQAHFNINKASMLASGSQRKGNTQNQVSDTVIVFSYSILISIWKFADSYLEQLI